MRTASFIIKNGPMNGGCAMRIEAMHDFDNGCGCPEDDNSYFVTKDGVFAFLADGCSEPYFGTQFMYPGGLTGGQVLVRTTKQEFSGAGQKDSLEDILWRANEAIWRVQRKHRGDKVRRDDSATLANASFSSLRFDRGSGGMEILWGADVFTIWLTKAGKVGIIGGDNREAELERERTFADLVASAKGDPEKERVAKQRYWLEEFPRLKRKQDNVLYAVLNGSSDISRRWRKEIVSEPVELVVLLSDGAWIPMEDWDQNQLKAGEFVRVLKAGGWNSALPWIREQQNHGLTSQRVKRPEASGLAIFAD